jgi:hypothetical protein
LTKKALPLTVTGGVLGLLIVVVARLTSDEAKTEDASDDARSRAVEAFMVVTVGGDYKRAREEVDARRPKQERENECGVRLQE